MVVNQILFLILVGIVCYSLILDVTMLGIYPALLHPEQKEQLHLRDEYVMRKHKS